MSKKMNSQAVGLDIGLSFIRWLTGAENLHYGIWTDLEVTAANLGQAQSVYTEKLFSYLPSGSLRILDVGGGAGETARKLIALEHQVDIVVPSPFWPNAAVQMLHKQLSIFANLKTLKLTKNLTSAYFQKAFNTFHIKLRLIGQKNM